MPTLLMSTERCKVRINEVAEKGYSIVFISGILNLFTAHQVRAELEPQLAR